MVRRLRFKWRLHRDRGIADRDDDAVEANSVRLVVHLVIEGGATPNLEIEDSGLTGQKRLWVYGEEK